MDTGNVSKKLKRGLGICSVQKKSKTSLAITIIQSMQQGQYQGLIGVGGLVLARIPEEVVEQRKKYFQNITADQVKSVDNDILREQRPEMPVNIDRQSRVSFGGSRKEMRV